MLLRVTDLGFSEAQGSILPTRAYPDDAGFDLYVARGVTIPARQFVDISCGVAVELPEGTWGFLTGRSSTLRKRGLLVHTGVIDVGYRGELFAGVWNLTDHEVTVNAGERISQLIVLQNTTERVTLTEVLSSDEFSPHPRGVRGFGSSGV